ncbi:MAG: 50S ribosomal protein L17 [Candidatus Omnitrophica bacterium]|nr:50S ribosomal protein L17 [Candidatus Omnitrophota bacterium]
MRHAKKRTRLNLTEGERKSLILNQCRSIFKYQRITTTYSRAKVVAPAVERIISLARVDNLTNRRRVFQKLKDHALVKKLFIEFAPLFKERNGGYTRILRLSRRRGDNANLVIFELIKRLPEKKSPPKAKKEEKAVTQEKVQAPKQVTPPKEKPKAPPTAKEEKPLKQKPTPAVKELPKDKKKGGKFFGGIGKIFRRKQEP